MEHKVFGIGLSKTGTKSLAAALAQLGYKSGHYETSIKALIAKEDQLEPDYDLINAWDALADIPVAAIYPKLDAYFPVEKFILTVRDKFSWLDSCERHYSADPSSYLKKHGIDPALLMEVRKKVFGQPFFSRERFSAAYDEHLASVLNYFGKRESDLIVLNICGGAGWPDLCRFLGKPIPDVAFPRENVSKVQSRARWSVSGSFRL
jgi:hypothetical protein